MSCFFILKIVLFLKRSDLMRYTFTILLKAHVHLNRQFLKENFNSRICNNGSQLVSGLGPPEVNDNSSPFMVKIYPPFPCP